MMGQHSRSEALFYYFRLEDQVPESHLLRLIEKHISFAFVREKLKDSYSETGRPSVDPELLLRILLIGYLYGITSERKLVEELPMHLAWRWFTGLGFDQEIPHHSTFSLVALYFAVCDESDQDGAVWIIDPWRWNRAHVKYLFGPAVPGWQETQKYLLDLEQAFDTDRNENQTREKWPVAIEPPHIDRRIAAQGSEFTLFGTKKNMTDSPAINRPRGGKGKHAVLDKIIVKQETAGQLREQLNQIGINGRAMFPGLEGLGKHISWEWKSRSVPLGMKKGTKRVRFVRQPEVSPGRPVR